MKTTTYLSFDRDQAFFKLQFLNNLREAFLIDSFSLFPCFCVSTLFKIFI